MTLLMERTESAKASAPTPAARTLSGSFEVTVSIGETAAFGFLLDPSGNTPAPGHFRRGRKRLPRYFDWLGIAPGRALSLVDELIPRNPEIPAPMPFGLLVSPRWDNGGRSLEIFVNTASRRHNDLLVRVPAWAKFLMGHQPIERWVALQPYLSRLGKVGVIGVETSSTNRRVLELLLAADGLRAKDLKRLATLAGAPSGELLHLWRSLPTSGGAAHPTLLTVGLSGRESLDVGVMFPARRAGSSSQIRKRLQLLAQVHGLEASRYLETIEELQRLTGRTPEHTMLGFSAKNGRIRITASLESVTSSASRTRDPGFSLGLLAAERDHRIGTSRASSR